MRSDDSFIHVTPSVSRLAGGLFESVRHLSHSVQAASRTAVTVIGVQDQQTRHDTHCWAPVQVRTHPSVVGPRDFSYAPGLWHDLLACRPSLVHLHGLWKYSSFAVWRWSQRSCRPYIVSPHGMLEPWALRQAPWKKRCALWLYTGPCLRRAACLRATSLAEATNIRRAGFTNPIAVVPNGAHCPPEPLLSSNPAESRNARALFLSRIHPKKGLLNLIRAWAALRPASWDLAIAGPDEAGHLEEAKALIRSLQLDRIDFLGELWGEAKTKVLLESDLFVLPSFSENFGLVIAEALACRVPVITTRATPWHELEHYRCGWWTDIGVEPLVHALKTAFALPRQALREMGGRGRALVQRRYAWEPIGKQMFEVYQWMLSRRDIPDYVLRQ